MNDDNRYIKVYKRIRDEIINGGYKYNTKIPSKRVTALDNHVSVITVQHAYELLEDEGYIVAKERSGYFVSYKENDGFASAINREINKNIVPKEESIFPFSVYAKTVRKVLSDNEEGIFTKSHSSGNLQFRSAISRYLLRSRDMKVKPEQIIIGAGAEYLYGYIVQGLGRDKIYGIESPSYEKISRIYQSHGVVYEFLPLGDDGIRSEALNFTEAEILHITPYRSFPSGISASASKKMEYIRWAEEHNALIVEDDVESEFSRLRKPEETIYAMDKNNNTIYVNSFSMTISPSVRIAYMVIPEKLVNSFSQRNGYLSCPVPTFDQLIMAEILESGDFERHLNRTRRKLRKQ